MLQIGSGKFNGEVGNAARRVGFDDERMDAGEVPETCVNFVELLVSRRREKKSWEEIEEDS